MPELQVLAYIRATMAAQLGAHSMMAFPLTSSTAANAIFRASVRLQLILSIRALSMPELILAYSRAVMVEAGVHRTADSLIWASMPWQLILIIQTSSMPELIVA